MSPWTIAHQAPLTMGFSRQEYWRGLPFPFPGDLPDPKPTSPESISCFAGKLFTAEYTANQAASAFLQFSQDSGNCKTKAHYEVIVSSQPIKDRDGPLPTCLQQQFSHSWKTLYALITKGLK